MSKRSHRTASRKHQHLKMGYTPAKIGAVQTNQDKTNNKIILALHLLKTKLLSWSQKEKTRRLINKARKEIKQCQR